MVAAVDMVLADSIVPILRLRTELAAPVVMYKQKEPNLLTLHVDGALEVFLDMQKGLWRACDGLETARKRLKYIKIYGKGLKTMGIMREMGVSCLLSSMSSLESSHFIGRHELQAILEPHERLVGADLGFLAWMNKDEKA